MSIKFTALSGLIIVFTAICSPLAVKAETETPSVITTNDAFDRAYFSHDRNFYDNTSLKRQIDSFFGPGKGFATTFTDNEIMKDGQVLNTLYHDILLQQSMNDPYLRTPDLPNPYNSSLLSSPNYNSNKLKVGTEYRFDNLPPR